MRLNGRQEEAQKDRAEVSQSGKTTTRHAPFFCEVATGIVCPAAIAPSPTERGASEVIDMVLSGYLAPVMPAVPSSLLTKCASLHSKLRTIPSRARILVLFTASRFHT